MDSRTVSSTPATPFPVSAYRPKYDKWPYSASDFKRYDDNDDTVFYRHPRFVTHIDDAAISRLTQYYDTVLPRAGTLLDVCMSWKSFYPSGVEEAVRSKALDVYGVGLNAEEMKANAVFRDEGCWRVVDLNREPYDVQSAWQVGKELTFDAATCVVSIDYLVRPLEVCTNLLRTMKEGGMLHCVVSNRCFPNKVVSRWMMLSEQARLELVGGELKQRRMMMMMGVCFLLANWFRLSSLCGLDGRGDCGSVCAG